MTETRTLRLTLTALEFGRLGELAALGYSNARYWNEDGRVSDSYLDELRTVHDTLLDAWVRAGSDPAGSEQLDTVSDAVTVLDAMLSVLDDSPMRRKLAAVCESLDALLAPDLEPVA